VPASSLVAFRYAFGGCGAFAVARFVSRGWVDRLLVDPPYHFTYPGLGWVRPLPAPAMYLVCAVAIVAALAFALGWRPRVSAAVFTVLFVYLESIDVATYLNHYELITLLGVLCVALPIPARGSTEPVPVGVVWLLRFQLAVVYVFAGLGKVDVDWLVHGEPLGTWLRGRSDLPVLGPLLAAGPTAIVLSWAGAIFDLTIVAFLLRRRTRRAAYAAVVAFHVATAVLFPAIGVFPLVMIVLTPIFLTPTPAPTPAPSPAPTPAPSPFLWRRFPPPGGNLHHKRWVTAAVVVWVAVQVLVPLRHLAYPGDVRWTEEGYRWSWRVLLTEKEGSVTFRLTDPSTGAERTVFPSDELAPFQVRAMSTRPDLIRQYAHHLADVAVERGESRPEVRADSWVAIAGHPKARLMDPAVDLAAEPLSWWPADDIEPSPL